MTIPATASQISYAGNGATLAFDIPFIFDTSSDITVITTDAAGEPTELSTGFSITGGSGSTGTCTFSVAPAVGVTVTLLDDPALTQPADYISNDAFPAETHEGALDRTVRLVKRLNQRVDRSIRVEDGDLSDGDELLLPISSTRAGMYLAFDAEGQPTVSEGTGNDSALRTDLASTTSGADGSRLVGYRRTETGARADASVYTALSRSIALTDFSGVDSTGVVDISTGFANWWAAVKASPGGYAVIPPGQYLCAAQCTMDGTFLGNTDVIAYGAEFFTTNAISALALAFSSTPHILTLLGMKVNHRGNATATAGIELVGTANARLKDCTVEAHGVGAGYAGFLLRNSDPTDTNTGCFWSVLEDCTVRKRAGADPGDIPYGIYVRGAANATLIRGGNVGGTVTNGVYVTPEAGQTYIANGLLIDGLALEGGTNGIHVNGAAGVGISGLRVVNCRAEAYTTFIRLAGSVTQPATPPFFAGNYVIPGVTYLSNANNLYYVSLDTEGGSPRGINLNLGGALEVWNTSGGGSDCITARAAAASSSMIGLKNSAGTLVGKFIQGTRTNTLKLQSQATGELELVTISGLSKSATACANFSGTATFAAATTVTVTFPTNNEVDGNYLVLLTPLADPVGRLWVSGRGTTGFTINNSSSTSITVVWQIFR